MVVIKLTLTRDLNNHQNITNLSSPSEFCILEHRSGLYIVREFVPFLIPNTFLAT